MNRNIVADVEAFGIESFRFSIISRHKTQEEMLAKEQRVLNAFYGRSCCYNLAHEVIEGTAPIRISALTPQSGKVFYFLSIHAASKELKIQKSEIKQNLTTSPYFSGGFVISSVSDEDAYSDKHFALMRKLGDLGIPNYHMETSFPFSSDVVRRVMATNSLDCAALASILGIMPSTVERLQSGTTTKLPAGPAMKLLALIDLYGYDWVNCDGVSHEFSAEEILAIQNQHEMSDEIFARLLDTDPVNVRRWGNDSKSPTVSEMKLIKLINIYGVKPLIPSNSSQYLDALSV